MVSPSKCHYICVISDLGSANGIPLFNAAESTINLMRNIIISKIQVLLLSRISIVIQ